MAAIKSDLKKENVVEEMIYLPPFSERLVMGVFKFDSGGGAGGAIKEGGGGGGGGGTTVGIFEDGRRGDTIGVSVGLSSIGAEETSGRSCVTITYNKNNKKRHYN